MAISGMMGAVYCKTGPSVSFTGVAMDNPSGDMKTFIIGNSSDRYWDTSKAVLIETSADGGNTWTTASGYVIEYPGGRVLFNTPLESGTQVRASGYAYPVTNICNFFNWELDITVADQDVTTFCSNGWEESIATLRGFNGKADWYWADSSFLDHLEDNEMVFVLYVDTTTNRRYEGYGLITKAGPKVPVDGIVNESIEFKGKDKVYYREG
ncbi:hypothetical protein H1164_03555 [Thermoactinomyces daqus]|uniref:Uncharacterized protein n=1 Tax=Thermoactinomyces daqus TaxID=1329516 RepID=A0A7W2AHQ9_9BACL|nr:hypothetical protein [Thermoactinomyces daqus]MBA4541979.1 hypothetical protein [Thermoactinomyces daqus]